MKYRIRKITWFRGEEMREAHYAEVQLPSGRWGALNKVPGSLKFCTELIKGVKARESEPKAHGFMQEIVYEEGD